MITKTRVLVLRCTPYGEHAVVARFLTRELGAYSYMLHGIRSKKSRITPAMLHPMALLDADVLHRPDSDLQRVQEMQSIPFGAGGYGTARQLLAATFIAEVLAQAIHDHDPQPELFDWLVDRMETLMGAERQAGLVLAMLTDLPACIGFSVDATTYQPGSRLSFIDGIFTFSEQAQSNSVSSKNNQRNYPSSGSLNTVQIMGVQKPGNDLESTNAVHLQQAVQTTASTRILHPNSNASPEGTRVDYKNDFADEQSSFEMAYYLTNSRWPDDFQCSEAYLQAVYGLYARQLPAFRIPRSHPMFCSLVLK